MTPRRVNPAALGEPVGYSHGVQAGGLLFVAGQIGADPADGGLDVVEGGLVAQFEKALSNIQTVLEEAGSTPQALVDMTVYVTDIDAYRASLTGLGEAWRGVMGDKYPAMALVEVCELFHPEALVEVKATAAIGGNG